MQVQTGERKMELGSATYLYALEATQSVAEQLRCYVQS